MLKTILYILLAVIAVILVLVLIALVKTLATPVKTSPWMPKSEPDREKNYAEKLSAMVQYETESRKGEIQREKFLGFHKLLEELFPLLHQKLEKTEIEGSLLYHWEGRNHDKPLVLMGHQDVVPAE